MDARAAARWPAVWAVFAGGLVAGAYIGKVPPALPVLRAELGLTLVQSGFVATMFNVVGGLAGMLAGVLADRFGPKRLALLGLAILSAGGFLGAAARSFAPLLIGRFLEGAGFILFTVAGAALMSAAAPEPRARAKALSLWSAYMPAGGSLALLAAPLVIGGSRLARPVGRPGARRRGRASRSSRATRWRRAPAAWARCAWRSSRSPIPAASPWR